MGLDDSYVIRIYRRGARPGAARRAYDRVALTGTIEHTASGVSESFHDIEELWTVLAQPEKKPPRPRRRQT
jgi:hypothetical protein